jgi:hypothetical protein
MQTCLENAIWDCVWLMHMHLFGVSLMELDAERHHTCLENAPWNCEAMQTCLKNATWDSVANANLSRECHLELCGYTVKKV